MDRPELPVHFCPSIAFICALNGLWPAWTSLSPSFLWAFDLLSPHLDTCLFLVPVYAGDLPSQLQCSGHLPLISAFEVPVEEVHCLRSLKRLRPPGCRTPSFQIPPCPGDLPLLLPLPRNFLEATFP